MRITEKEYLDAIKIVQEYNEQIKFETEKTLQPICLKTPREIGRYNLGNYFSARISSILINVFENCRICDIKKDDFLAVRNAGKKSWEEFNNVIKIN